MSSAVTYTSPEMLPKLAEWHVYGNEQQGRFLTKYPEEETPTYYGTEVTLDVQNNIFKRQLGKKAYELKDHLGNVRVTFSDIKMPTGSGSQPFMVDLLSKSEYYPYGMKINDLSYNATGARYGYNGTHEQDKELNADGNYLDFGNFGYDTRVAMRRNQEPLRTKFPYLSGYAIFANNPIYYKDPDGNHSLSDHIKIRVKAISTTSSKVIAWFNIPGIAVEHLIADVVFAGEEALHLDNQSNGQLQDLIISGILFKSQTHTRDDFYCHTNYLEILLENGYKKDDDLPTIRELKKANPDVFNIVLKNIQSTNNNTIPLEAIGTKKTNLAIIADKINIAEYEKLRVHPSNNKTDHNATPELEAAALPLKQPGEKESWGNSLIFWSKHKGHPLYELSLKLSLKDQIQEINELSNSNNEKPNETNTEIAP